MTGYTELRRFKEDELILDSDETIAVLTFFFPSSEHAFIESLPLNSKTIAFAQGLLVEAIDASYQVGFIRAIFESTIHPGKGARRAIKSFARKASKHWFRHASVNDLQNVKIYDFVRDELRRSFRTDLRDLIVKDTEDKRFGRFVNYRIPKLVLAKRWI